MERKFHILSVISNRPMKKKKQYVQRNLNAFTLHESQCTLNVGVELTRCRLYRQTLYPNNMTRPSQCVSRSLLEIVRFKLNRSIKNLHYKCITERAFFFMVEILLRGICDVKSLNSIFHCPMEQFQQFDYYKPKDMTNVELGHSSC